MQRQPKYSRDLPEERRRKLIEATARCLAELGVAGTSVREISLRAEVSPGLVNHHFAGKEDLIAQTYWQIGETVDRTLGAALVAAGPDPDARLTAFVKASFEPPILDSDLLAVWIGFWSLVRTDTRVFGMHREVYAAYRERLEGLLGAAAEKRGVTLDTRLTAISLSAMLDGLWLEWCLDPEVFSADEGCQTVLNWIGRLWAFPDTGNRSG
ncbi:TetR/AcrR family transcriptional regulator [Limibacillus halophilus]|uniref:AcrR family transcriptional regulator n=1 Tax=Limibacillus halophilus TaxID=1579333 RepID=A0A839SXE2_9PROT|nr:TetR family transcriptional regulator C-terminal domain-containing protein [Limibacillus halophilus]MBB3066739.1 AcrR family transcriptional regulator [Limibacillus halophilus]